MTVDEVRAIREKKSLETIEMTTKELNAYFNNGAEAIKKMIEEVRLENSNVLSHKYRSLD